MPKEKPRVNIGEVIRTYRGQRSLSQGDIERRTGLLRCYLSRVENGHTVPSLETLAKIAEAMDIRQKAGAGDDPQNGYLAPAACGEKIDSAPPYGITGSV